VENRKQNGKSKTLTCSNAEKMGEFTTGTEAQRKQNAETGDLKPEKGKGRKSSVAAGGSPAR
jgi:hypothetical protein